MTSPLRASAFADSGVASVEAGAASEEAAAEEEAGAASEEGVVGEAVPQADSPTIIASKRARIAVFRFMMFSFFVVHF